MRRQRAQTARAHRKSPRAIPRDGPSRPRSNAARARRTRRALLAAGRAVWTERGYAHTTLSEILRRAGVTSGALYYHFPSTAAFFAAVFAALLFTTTPAFADAPTMTDIGASLQTWADEMAALKNRLQEPEACTVPDEITTQINNCADTVDSMTTVLDNHHDGCLLFYDEAADAYVTENAAGNSVVSSKRRRPDATTYQIAT